MLASNIKCPVCGSSTRLRTSKKDGSKFHVCVNWPDCKGKVVYDDEWEEEPQPVRKELVRADGQDSKWTRDSNEVKAVRFERKLARRSEIIYGVLSILFLLIGFIPVLFYPIGSIGFWGGSGCITLSIILAIIATIYNAKVRHCKKELIRLVGSPK